MIIEYQSRPAVGNADHSTGGIRSKPVCRSGEDDVVGFRVQKDVINSLQPRQMVDLRRDWLLLFGKFPAGRFQGWQRNKAQVAGRVDVGLQMLPCCSLHSLASKF